MLFYLNSLVIFPVAVLEFTSALAILQSMCAKPSN